MSAAFSTAVLVLTVLTHAPEAGAQPSVLECAEQKLRVELPPQTSGRTWEICANADSPVVLVFDPPLPARARVDMMPEARLVASQGLELLTFLPVPSYQPGERTTVTVHFEDALEPESVSFVFVGHSDRAVSQIRITRHARVPKPGEQQVLSHGECLDELARLRSETGRFDGLRSLLATELMNRTGVSSRFVSKASPLEGSALKFMQAATYRSKRRVAVEVKLHFLQGEPWTVAGALLMGSKGEQLTSLPPWNTGPLGSSAKEGWVVVEFEATKEQAQGVFTLNIWDESGRTAAVGEVSFPDLREPEKH
jgi:uncharacterized protein (TIGR02268 family)